jgi:hypothetical protein
MVEARGVRSNVEGVGMLVYIGRRSNRDRGSDQVAKHSSSC